MKKILILLLIPLSAHALNFTWIHGAPVVGADEAGFNIKCGAVSGNYTTTIIINNGLATSHTEPGFPNGLVFCAMTAFDANGGESSLSNEMFCEVLADTCLVQSPPNAPINFLMQ